MRFNEKADEYLDSLYKSVGATTWEQKFNTLCLKLGLRPKEMSFSHNPSWEQKAAMLEYELLEDMRLISITYV